MLNHIVIMGRLTRDPELRSTTTGVNVASFRIACNRDYSGRGGSEPQTDFVDCVAWRQTGEFVSRNFTKGKMIIVSGRLQMRDWTDRDGNKRTTAEIVADNVYFGESKRDSDGQSGGNYGPSYGSQGSYGGQSSYGSQSGYSSQPTQVPPVTPSPFEDLEGDDGDLPF